MKLALALCLVSSVAHADFDEVTIETKPEIDVTTYGKTTIVDVREGWFATIGDTTRTRLDPAEFFRTVEREDLARSYERRMTIGRVSAVVGLAGLAFGAVLLARDTKDAYMAAGAISAGGGALALGVGALFFRYANPVSEDEARYLADMHNATVRERRRMSVTVVPGGAGIAASGSF